MKFRLEPYAHQREEWERSRSMPGRGIFWDMGCGKSKITIDTLAWLYMEGKIDAAIILAPNGVHENWTTDELPKHVPTDIDYWAETWHSSKAANKGHQQAMERLLKYNGLAVLCISYNGFMTKRGMKFCRKFLDKRRVFYVADESQRIKTPSAKRTKSILASAKYAEYTRILSGTPVTKNPLDVYSQLKFLDVNFWKKRGFASYEAFKTHFAVWESFEMKDGDGNVTGRFTKPIYFRNTKQLHDIVAEVSSRVEKDDVLDLPPKVYSKRHFDLDREQIKAYKQLKEEMMIWLDSGDVVTAPLIVTQLLRLQQITCGYIPDDIQENPDGTAKLHRFPKNPRLKLLKELIEEDVNGQAIIWARFREDITQICEFLGDRCVRYDGSTSQADRLEARQRFQAGDVEFFVANPAAAATGLTLTAAKTVIYYSNSFDYEHRVQSEDRAHRIGQDSSVLYIDLVARGTVDTKIVQSLRDKKNIASEITGDKVRSWI